MTTTTVFVSSETDAVLPAAMPPKKRSRSPSTKFAFVYETNAGSWSEAGKWFWPNIFQHMLNNILHHESARSPVHVVVRGEKNRKNSSDTFLRNSAVNQVHLHISPTELQHVDPTYPTQVPSIALVFAMVGTGPRTSKVAVGWLKTCIQLFRQRFNKRLCGGIPDPRRRL